MLIVVIVSCLVQAALCPGQVGRESSVVQVVSAGFPRQAGPVVAGRCWLVLLGLACSYSPDVISESETVAVRLSQS